MKFSTKIEALIVEIESAMGADRSFPITLELAKATLAARKIEAAEQGSRKVEEHAA
jgi:hypothetical protein